MAAKDILLFIIARDEACFRGSINKLLGNF